MADHILTETGDGGQLTTEAGTDHILTEAGDVIAVDSPVGVSLLTEAGDFIVIEGGTTPVVPMFAGTSSLASTINQFNRLHPTFAGTSSLTTSGLLPARVSQVSTEVIAQDPNPDARVSQVSTEVLIWSGSLIQLTLAGTSALTIPVLSNWVAPPGVHQIKVECWGGGGGGRSGGLLNGTPGGGGGAYASTIFLPVTPGMGYSYTVGAAGAINGNGGTSTFIGDAGRQVSAVGGKTAVNDTNGGVGGLASACTGDFATNGGRGGNGQGLAAGAGGGAAGSALGDGAQGVDQTGTSHTGTAGGVGVGGAGSGGRGADYGVTNAGTGGTPGGGGGGHGSANSNEAPGGPGAVAIDTNPGVPVTFAGTSSLTATFHHIFPISKTQYVDSTASTSGTISLPVGVQQGDLLIMAGGDIGSTTTDPVISGGGWTVRANSHSQSGINGVQLWVATKIATGSEPSSYTIGGPTTRHAVLLAYRATDFPTGAPDAIAISPAGSGSDTAPSVTPTQSNDLEVYISAAKAGSGGASITPGASWVQREQFANATSGMFAQDRLDLGAGTSATGTVTPGTTSGGATGLSTNMVFKTARPIPFAGTSALSTYVIGTRVFSLALAGHSTLTATITPRYFGANFHGTSALTTTVHRRRHLNPTFAGVGHITPHLSRVPLRVNTTFAGVGHLTATLVLENIFTLTLHGSSSLATTINFHPRAIRPAFHGTSTLSVNLHRKQFTLAVHGVGHITATISTTGGSIINRTLTLAGVGHLTAPGFGRKRHLFPTFAGTSALGIIFTAPIYPEFDGTSTLDVSISGVSGNLQLILQGYGTMDLGYNAPRDIDLTLSGTSSFVPLVGETANLRLILLTLSGTSTFRPSLTHKQFPVRLQGHGYITFTTGLETQSTEITQLTAETMTTGSPTVRASQITLETLATPDRSLTEAETRVSQITLEVMRPYSTVRIHIRYPVNTTPD